MGFAYVTCVIRFCRLAMHAMSLPVCACDTRVNEGGARAGATRSHTHAHTHVHSRAHTHMHTRTRCSHTPTPDIASKRRIFELLSLLKEDADHGGREGGREGGAHRTIQDQESRRQGLLEECSELWGRLVAVEVCLIMLYCVKFVTEFRVDDK